MSLPTFLGSGALDASTHPPPAALHPGKNDTTIRLTFYFWRSHTSSGTGDADEALPAAAAAAHCDNESASCA